MCLADENPVTTAWQGHHGVVMGLVTTILSFSTPRHGKGLPRRDGQVALALLDFLTV